MGAKINPFCFLGNVVSPRSIQIVYVALLWCWVPCMSTYGEL